MTKKDLNLYRIEELESNYKDIDAKLDKLLTNHLPHIESRMLSLETKINVMTAINVSAVIIGIIVSNYVIK